MCERSGATAADESRVPEPAVAAGDWDVYAGCRCEARHLASDPNYELWQTFWFAGTIAALCAETRTCKVQYDDPNESVSLWSYKFFAQPCAATLYTSAVQVRLPTTGQFGQFHMN